MRPLVNIVAAVTEGDVADPVGYKSRGLRFGPLIGAEQLGASVYDLDPGDSVCPYHYETPEEEWLLVWAGSPTLRDPDGEHELSPGDLVCFPEGPDGAHKVTNRTEEPVRIVMFSTKTATAMAIYPDSNKVGIWPLGKLFRIDDAVDYWEGEL
jgi:uncharacterized cupin superfamily protein